MGQNRIIFAPYKSHQIKLIIEERLKVLSDVGIFKKGVADYISKKIAVISSDIRRTLKLCKQCVEEWALIYSTKRKDQQDFETYNRLTAVPSFELKSADKTFISDFRKRLSKMTALE